VYEQLSKELKASLFQRIKSPFFGSFFIGWFIFNYRFIIVLFSVDTTNLIMNVKPLLIPLINFQIEPIYLTTLIYPFFIALIYIGIVPFFEYYVSMPIWKTHQNRLKEKYAKLEKEEIFLGTEKDKYLNEIMNMKKEKNKLVEELTNIDLANQTKIKNMEQKKEEDFLKEKEKMKTDFQIQLKEHTKNKTEELEKEKEKLNLEIDLLKNNLNNSNKKLTELIDKNEEMKKILTDQLEEIALEKDKKLNEISLKNNKLLTDLTEK
jgi:DNA repair exonuclease SbcCD ATPase subunit